MTAQFKVRVFINKNIKKFIDAFQPGDELVEALDFDLESESVDMALACVFQGLNVDNAPELGSLSSADLLIYHLIFPSFSVGDVVEIDGYKFACEPVGWKEIGPRQMTCKICHHLAWTADDHNVCADCRQGDWATDLEETAEIVETSPLDLFIFEWKECTMDEFDFFSHISPEEYIYCEGQTYQLTTRTRQETGRS